MRPTTLLTVLSLVALCGVTAFGRAQARPSAQEAPPPRAGLIVGRVIDADSRRPLTGAIVRLEQGVPRPSPDDNRPAVVTGSDGRFAFERLPPGNYRLSVSRNRYRRGGFGTTGADGTATVIALAPGERFTDAEIRLYQLGAISGRVTDERGRPVVGVTAVLERETWKGDMTSGAARTDDQGNYSITAPPGRYRIRIPLGGLTVPASRYHHPPNESSVPSAGVRAPGDRFMYMPRTGPAAPRPANPGEVYVTTWHPAVTTREAAGVWTLASGNELTGIDLRLQTAPAVQFSGTVLGPDGPVENAQLRLVSDFDGFSFQPVDEGHNAVSDSNGAFAFLDVPAGDYTVVGIRRVQQSDVIFPDPDGLWVRNVITLRAGEAPHLDLRLQPGVTVSGTIAVDGSPPGRGQPPGVFLRSPAQRGSTGASPRQGVLPADQFRITGVYPGTYRIMAGGGRTLTAPESIMLDGRDVTDLPVVIDRSFIRDVRVSLTRRVAALRGSLIDRLGKPAIGDWVVVFSVDPVYWPHVEDDSYRTKRYPVDSDGVFITNGLTAGEYFVAGVSAQTMDAWPDVRLFEDLSRNATRLTLMAGPNSDIRLTVVR